MEDKKYDKVIMLSDVHYGVHASSIEWLENIDDYFKNFFIPLLRKEVTDNTCILILGDYFDNRQSTDINIMVSAIKNIKALASYAPVYMMVGNHDLYKKSGLDKSSLSCLENISNVHVIGYNDEGIKIIQLINNTNIALISWVGDYLKETTLINQYKTLASIICLHTELCGMSYDNGREITEGTVVKVGKNKKIFSGHIHRRQISKNNNLIYVGSPYHTERSDIGDKKGIYMLCVENNETVVKFIENNYSPEFIKVNLTFEAGNWTLDQPFEKITNNYVDIILTEETANAINSAKVTEELLKYKPKRLEFHPITKVINVETGDEIYHDTGVVTVFENTVEKLNLTKEQLEKIKTINDKYIKAAAEELGIQI